MAQSRQRHDCESPVLEGVPAPASGQSVIDVDSCYLSQRLLRHWACFFGLAGILIGILGLIARLSGSVLLGSFIPHTKVISPAAALSVLALGALVVLVALVRNQNLRRLSMLAYLLMSLQVLVLLEHFHVIPGGVSSLLLLDHFSVQIDPRASVPEALSFVLLSLCFVFWPPWHRRHLVVALAAAAGALILPFALGSVYGLVLLSDTSFSPIVVPAAAGIIAIATGVLLAAFASLQARKACDAHAETNRRETMERLTKELRARGDQLEAVISSIADAVSITDADGALARCNDAARRMLRYGGYEDAAWDNRAQRCTYLHPEGAEFAHEDLPLSRSLRGETVTGEMIHMTWPDGTWRLVTSSSAPLRNADGDIVGAVLTNTDMTALHETQQETQRLLAQVQAEREWTFCLLDTLPAYVCLIRPDHQIAYANGRFSELFGAPADGEKCYERIVGCNHACEDCRAFQPLNTGEPVNYEWRHP
ncbi:MAG: PAS domain-containing protein, partial [Bacteroidota bacterium]